MNIEKGDRILAVLNAMDRYRGIDHLGTVIDVDNDSCTIQCDEDKSIHVVTPNQLMFVREEFRTDPRSARGQLMCKNCGWDGSSHVPFAPHYCREKVTRKSLMERNEQPVPANAVFEAHVIIPIERVRPDNTEISREYIEAIKNFDENVFKV